MARPWCVVVAGVSGAGKSSVARLLARTTGAALADGDDFHSPAALAKMHAGRPLDDADRQPWLEAIGAWADEQHLHRNNAVVSCSALRQDYRDTVSAGRPWIRFCLLDVPAGLLRLRLAGRRGHFMPPALLSSQLALLEPLADGELGVTLDAAASLDLVAAAAIDSLGLCDDR